MTIRPARPEDMEAIAEIQASAPEASQWNPAEYLPHGCAVAVNESPGRDETWPSGGRVKKIGEGIAGEHAAAGERITSERVVGFLVWREISAGEREILNIAVAREYRRRGVARQLLRYALAQTRSTWFLEVRESNFRAIALYESVGFQRCGVRAAYYRAPLEPAIVMKIDS
jgi:ribosomal-protein-alanine acetyltransferase